MGFGTVLKDLLNKKDLTIKELAEKSGLSVNTLYGITKNDNAMVRNETLQKIADALGVSVGDMISLLAQDVERQEQEFHQARRLLEQAQRLEVIQRNCYMQIREALKELTGYSYTDDEIKTVVETAKLMKYSDEYKNAIKEN
ncbi:helix-turn-helix transcriptional regulator [Enterocloster citroniae]|uniref:helix-turn-helix domain-containing protein n=1 Tax=Enterocloster citroniae TaxID=358743 RepID=UPI002E78F098|nr:helix-turn-helix transcriptional regulator [Enterocloster citroniae]